MLGSVILLLLFLLFCYNIYPTIVDYYQSQQESAIQVRIDERVREVLDQQLQFHQLEIKRNAQAHSARCKRLEECYEAEYRKAVEFYENRIEILKEHHKRQLDEVCRKYQALEIQKQTLQQEYNKLSTPEYAQYRKTIEQLKKEKDDMSKQFNQYILKNTKSSS